MIEKIRVEFDSGMCQIYEGKKLLCNLTTNQTDELYEQLKEAYVGEENSKG